MFCICVLIIAAAAVYMVEAYIHTYYAIEYMHGAPLFFVLLAKYAAPVLFLLLCVYFVFRYREKRRESEKPAQDKQENREEVYAEKINATVKKRKQCSQTKPTRCCINSCGSDKRWRWRTA